MTGPHDQGPARPPGPSATLTSTHYRTGPITQREVKLADRQPRIDAH